MSVVITDPVLVVTALIIIKLDVRPHICLSSPAHSVSIENSLCCFIHSLKAHRPKTRNSLMMMFFMWQTTDSQKTIKEMQKFVLMTI